jgi:hypothetical protein
VIAEATLVRPPVTGAPNNGAVTVHQEHNFENRDRGPADGVLMLYSRDVPTGWIAIFAAALSSRFGQTCHCAARCVAGIRDLRPPTRAHRVA